MKESLIQTTLRVALYIRVSTDEQVERYGIPLQREALKALIQSRPKLEGGRDGMILAEGHIYIDEGITGTLPLDERPAFAKLKESIIFAPEGQKPFDAVAVYKIDRFARKLKILLDIIEFFDQNDIKFISANESIDTSTPFGKAMLGIIGIIAELERDTIVQRTQAGRKQAFESGVALGVPYGYIKDENKRLKVFEEERKIVEEIFYMFVSEGRSPDYIAKYLTNHKILSPRASSIVNKKRKGEVRKKNEAYFWQTDAVRRTLRDEVYIGKIYGSKFKEGKLLPRSEWIISPEPAPSIIDAITFAKAQQLLTDSVYRKREATDKHTYLLRGLLRCDCCYKPEKDTGGRMRWQGERRELVKDGKKFSHYYKCPRKNLSKSLTWCPALPLPAKELEKYIVNFANKLLKSPIAVFNHQQELASKKSTLKHLRQKEQQIIGLISAIPDRKRRIAELHEAGGTDIKQLRAKVKELDINEKTYREELEETRKQISQETMSEGYIESLKIFSKKYKDALEKNLINREELYTLLHELIEEIVVYSRPTKKGDIIAGRHREGQQIPHRLHIKLKLPQDIIQQLKPSIPKTTGGGSGYEMIGGGAYRDVPRTHNASSIKNLVDVLLRHSAADEEIEKFN